jgi:glutathione S-transferase
MSIVLYYHPYSRAANVVWMLEEVQVPYELRYVDIQTGEQKRPEITALNRMGKLPILQDDSAVVTESAAIGVYLADRYALGSLAPALDDPNRGTYLRWSFFAPSVIEPGAMAKAAGWNFREGAAGFGNYDSMVSAIQSAITEREFLLGDRFSMADVIFGGTLRYMLRFKMLEPLPEFAKYVEQLELRPALQRANTVNAKVIEERGLGRS